MRTASCISKCLVFFSACCFETTAAWPLGLADPLVGSTFEVVGAWRGEFGVVKYRPKLKFVLAADNIVRIAAGESAHGDVQLLPGERRSQSFTWKRTSPDTLVLTLEETVRDSGSPAAIGRFEAREVIEVNLPANAVNEERFVAAARTTSITRHGPCAEESRSIGGYEFKVVMKAAGSNAASIPRGSDKEPKSGCLYFLGVAAESFREPFSKLQYCVEDVRAIRGAVAKAAEQSSCQFVPMTIDGDDTTQEDVLDLLHELERVTAVQDTVVICVSTHGVTLERGLYMLLPDSRPRSLQETALGWPQMASAILNMKAGRVVVFLDTCHAGDFGRAHVDVLDGLERDLAARPGLTVIASSDGSHESLELSDLGHGAFTVALLDALPQVNVFEKGSGNALFTPLQKRVLQLTGDRQRPVLIRE
jgi:hypothetical protein